jgi:uncharacterized protein (DUF885 family)
MKKLISFTLICTVLIACNNQQKVENKQVADMNPQFENYKSQFIENLWKIYPNWASSQGYHKYDSILIIPNLESTNNQLAFVKSNMDSLKSYDLATLSDNNKTDYYMIENQLKSIDWSIKEQRSFQWNPSQYNVSGDFSEILNGTYDSLNTRLDNFYLKMRNIPAYYEAAKNNIKNPTLVHTQLAIDQNLGGISVFETDYIKALAKTNYTAAEKTEMQVIAKKAVVAIKDFVDWLKKLDNKTPRDFQLGKELYAKKFEFDIQSGYTVDEVYEKALAHKKDLHEKMFILADKLWSKYMANATKPADKLVLIRQVIDKISLNHVKPDSFQLAIEEQIPKLINFVKEKNLIYIDPSKPLVVRKEPAYMAGIAGASISAPGPYDKNANTYYNVGSLSGWSKEKAESYLREYNYYTLQILNIHEAIPGHYTQLVYSNQSPSLIKSLFGNSAMIEGWAVYTERMMLENGYGNNEDEMWLMYYKWNLRSTCNMILDYSVHTKNMSKEEALNLLMNEAFQQKTEADGKWKRVSVTQVQLCCYFTGYTEIYDFREELKKQMGDKFNLKQFHEKFLSYGSAPVKYIKELMLAELNASK